MTSRREFLAGIAAAGASTLMQRVAPPATRRAIDVHHHLVPPKVLAAHRDEFARVGAGNGQGPNAALLKKIYVDTAGNTQDTMDDLRELGMLNTQVMFGTDNPYGGEDAVGTNLTRLMSFKLSQAELDAIGRNNATKLFPTLA